jgi:hypothetical protein
MLALSISIHLHLPLMHNTILASKHTSLLAPILIHKDIQSPIVKILTNFNIPIKICQR